jgi:aldehyde dehydrogenase (NAD+)
MTTADVRLRVQAAADAQSHWKQTTFAERRRVLRALRKAILTNRGCILSASVQETGKTLVDAQLGELLTTLEKIRWLLREGERALAPEFRSVGPFTIHKRAFVQFEPLGVIAAIAPWNYPFHNLMNPVLAALFAGNAIVVKCSEYSSWCTVHYVKLIRQVLTGCGHPPELVQLVTGRAAAGHALVTDPGVKKVFFTGSTAVGRQVARAAAEQLKPCVLELGGKDALIICDDADLEQAVTISMRGVFQNSGQNCVGVERILVQRSRYEAFVAKTERQVRSLRLCDDVGAMTMGQAALRQLESLVADAVARGARLLSGGKATRSFYWEPTLLCDVPRESRILREEVFGPVMVIIPFENDEEAIQLANDCPYGLGSSVFTADRARAAKIRNQLQVGMVNENDFGVNYLCQSLPFGGTKDSGSDRFAGVEGLRGCCLMKSVTQDRYWCLRTRIPAILQYPIRPTAAVLLDALIRFIYEEDDLWARLAALVSLARPSDPSRVGCAEEATVPESKKGNVLSNSR